MPHSHRALLAHAALAISVLLATQTGRTDSIPEPRTAQDSVREIDADLEEWLQRRWRAFRQAMAHQHAHAVAEVQRNCAAHSYEFAQSLAAACDLSLEQKNIAFAVAVNAKLLSSMLPGDDARLALWSRTKKLMRERRDKSRMQLHALYEAAHRRKVERKDE